MEDILANIINTDEIRKFDNMYSGDCARDASSGIRGFLFQDLVALNYLVDEETEYICSEYLEDVDVFCTDSTVKVMQVKYYPKTSPNRKEIMGDLYYQYLRFKILKSKLNLKPALVIHRSVCPKKTTLKEMQDEIVGIKRTNKPEEILNPEEWLEKNVYCHEKKEKQKEVLFEKAAYDGSIDDFLNTYESFHVPEKIKDYKIKVEKKIDLLILDKGEFDEEDIRLQVLLGLAINFIQKRYEENTKSGLLEFKCEKNEFINYLSQHIKTRSEECIIAYLATLVYEIYLEIVADNIDLTCEQISMLNAIVKNTQVWICKLAKSVDGQFQILNTVSFDKKAKLLNFKNLTLNKRYEKIIVHEKNIYSFLNTLWKFMMNLNVDMLDKEYNPNSERFRPDYYVDASFKEYICIKFTGDSVKSSIIIPGLPSDLGNKVYDDIYSRMYDIKPPKWYMPNSNLYRGVYEYKFSVADVGDGSSVADVEKDFFRIECMKCIGLDKYMWHKVEDCSTCVFTNYCIKE